MHAFILVLHNAQRLKPADNKHRMAESVAEVIVSGIPTQQTGAQQTASLRAIKQRNGLQKDVVFFLNVLTISEDYE